MGKKLTFFIFLAITILLVASGGVIVWAKGPGEYLDRRHYEMQPNAGVLDVQLKEVSRWRKDSGIKIHGVFDFDQFLKTPGAMRGKNFRITGHLQQIEHVSPLSRPRRWDDSLEQWAIFVGKNKDEREKSVYILITQPPSVKGFIKNGRGKKQARENARLGITAGITAKFLGLWERRIEDEKYIYPVFVSQGADVIYPGSLKGKADTGFKFVAAWALLIPVAGVLVYLRYQINKRKKDPLASRTSRYVCLAEELAGEPLSKDPAEALSQLEKRNAGYAEQVGGGHPQRLNDER